MNETTADIVGGEVGRALLQQYYPEVSAKYASLAQLASLPANPTSASFDFRTEMHTTRVRVDALLAAGKDYRSRKLYG